LSRNSIVINGRRRLRGSPEVSAERARIAAEVRAGYEPMIQQARGLERWRLRIGRELVIRRRLKTVDEPGRAANWLRR
jgi:hypothetical protein